MQLTGLEAALIAVIGAFLCGAAGWWFGKRNMVTKEECLEMQSRCGVNGLMDAVAEIQREQKAQGSLIRLLCEKNGITVKEQLEICKNGDSK